MLGATSTNFLIGRVRSLQPMSNAASSSKKRKRNEEDNGKDSGEYVTFALAENEDSAAVGPLLGEQRSFVVWARRIPVDRPFSS